MNQIGLQLIYVLTNIVQPLLFQKQRNESDTDNSIQSCKLPLTWVEGKIKFISTHILYESILKSN